jgi:hypothetical protein
MSHLPGPVHTSTSPSPTRFDPPGAYRQFETPLARLYNAVVSTAEQRRGSFGAPRLSLRPALPQGVFWVAALATFRGALERRPALAVPPATRRHLRIAGLALILVAPVYGLIVWAVSESLGMALLALGVVAGAHVTYEVVRLSLWAVAYPVSRELPQPAKPAAPEFSQAEPKPAPEPEPQPSPLPTPMDPTVVLRQVEQALKHLDDYAWLGDSPLVGRLGIVESTHVARGKALRERLEAAIESLRPAGPSPVKAWPPEWQGYGALRLAYIEDVPNREIMARLFLAESTFARLRRKAVRAVARSVVEQDRASQPDSI